MADPYRTAALRAGRRPNLYIPEENPEWQAGQALIGPEAAWRRNYEFVLEQTGDPQRAEAAANSIARTERRQELTQLATSVAGPVMRGGELAAGLASRVMGGSRAAEAPNAMRALPAPTPVEPRAPVAREPLPTPGVIPMGGPLRDAPQIGYVRPEQRYTMRDIRQPGERAGPPTRYQMEARESARRPVLDETYVPLEDVRVPKDVVSDPGGIPTMNTEGKMPVSNAPRWADARLREEQRVADMIAEGNIAPDAMRNARALSDRDEAIFLARQQAQATDDGMGALSGQYRYQPGTAVVPAQTRALQNVIDKHFGAPTVAQAEGGSMATGPTYFAEVPAGGPRLVGESFAGPQAPGDWYRYASAKAADPASVGGISPLLKYGLPAAFATGVGGGALYKYANSNGLPPAGSVPSGVPGGVPGIAPAAGAPAVAAPTSGVDERFSGTETAAMPTVPDRTSGVETAGMPLATDLARADAARRIAMDEREASTSGAEIAKLIARNRAASAASNQSRAQEALAQPRRPQEGILSSIFGRPATTKQLFEQSQADPGDAGAWMRAERQYARTHRDQEGGPNFDVTKLNEQGMKRGGSAGKPDSVHKALEIIHHLIASR